MITIAYYISDYGYGHASRSVAVIRSILQQSGQFVKIIVCSCKTLPFLMRSLNGVGQVEYRRTSSDVGYVLQPGSIEPDIERLRVEYNNYIRLFSYFVDIEYRFLVKEKVDLVISDISPKPIAAANLAGITSVGVSNFTWYTAYKEMLDEALLEPLYDAYSKMDYFISLAGAGEPHWGRRGHMQADFFCRTPNLSEIEKIKMKLNPCGSKLTVFFALGMGISVRDLNDMALWQDESCLFVLSSNMPVERSNVTHIPDSYTESQHYLAASDIVISKPGWGTVSEAFCFGKPIILLQRGSFPEDRYTVGALNERHPYKQLTWEQLKLATIRETLMYGLQTDRFSQPASTEKGTANDITRFVMGLVS